MHIAGGVLCVESPPADAQFSDYPYIVKKSLKNGVTQVLNIILNFSLTFSRVAQTQNQFIIKQLKKFSNFSFFNRWQASEILHMFALACWFLAATQYSQAISRVFEYTLKF